MPVHHFIDPAHLVEHGLRNYWGYDTIGYFAPAARYSSAGVHGPAPFARLARRGLKPS